MKLQILHTNDIHSHFEKLPLIKTCIQKNKKEHVLVLDGGDFHDMKSLTLLGSDAKAGIVFLKACGYDAMTLGNNDLWSGEGNFENIIQNEDVNVLSCNIDYYPSREIPLKRSIIKKFEDVKVCIIGVSVGSDSYNSFSHLYGLHVKDPLVCIQQEIEMNEADIYILLSHMGIQQDREIAQKLPIDLIIGGHSHTLMRNHEYVNGTYIHQAGEYGEHVGECLIDIENKKIRSVTSQMYDTKDYLADERMEQLVVLEERKAIEVLKQPFVELPFEMSHDWVCEDDLTNFIADASLKVMSADFAIANSGLCLHGLQRKVSKADVFDAAPSPLNVSRAYLKGEQVLEALKLSMDPNYCLHEERAPGFRGKIIGHLSVSKNVEVIVKENTIEVFIDGKKLEKQKNYLVCAYDFLFRGSGYPSLFSEDHLESDKLMIKDVIIQYLLDEKLVLDSKIRRIKFNI